MIARTYADHLRDWENARQVIAEGRDSPCELSIEFELLLDALENLLDATAFKDSAALRRQTEIVQRVGRIGTDRGIPLCVTKRAAVTAPDPTPNREG